MVDDSLPLGDRLQRRASAHNADFPQYIYHRPFGPFSLANEPLPSAARRDVSVIVYPHDPFVSEPEVRQMDKRDIQDGMVNDRFVIQDNRLERAEPDAEGHYFYWPGTPQFEQVNALYHATFTLQMVERYARRTLPWSFGSDRLGIDPDAGQGQNAFYSEIDALIGFNHFKGANDSLMSAAESADIISHETAHAILDGMREFYNESFGLGSMAFHESFGDMVAVLVALHDEALVQQFLKITKGDLRVRNFVSSVGEYMLNEADGAETPGYSAYLRNALSQFTAQPFENMPYYAKQAETELAREPHNYGRLFTGAFYELLVLLYEQIRADKGVANLIALHQARDIAGRLLIGALEVGPVGEFDYRDMVLAFLTADHLLFESRYASPITQAFQARGLVDAATAAAHHQFLTSLPEVMLPNALFSQEAARQFLVDDVLPALASVGLVPKETFLPLRVYRNADGYVFMPCASYRKMPLEGREFKQNDGMSYEVLGGLTLAFTPENRLCSVTLREVSEQDLREIRRTIAELIKFGLIDVKVKKPVSNQPHYEHPDQPEGVVVTTETAAPHVVKFPVIFERLPETLSTLGHFFEDLQGRLKRSR